MPGQSSLKREAGNNSCKVLKAKPHFDCSVCGSSFKRSEHLARHYRSHTLERPFGCEQCGTKFSRKDLVVRHARTCNGIPSRRRRISLTQSTSVDDRASLTTAKPVIQSTWSIPMDAVNSVIHELAFPETVANNGRTTWTDRIKSDTDSYLQEFHDSRHARCSWKYEESYQQASSYAFTRLRSDNKESVAIGHFSDPVGSCIEQRDLSQHDTTVHHSSCAISNDVIHPFLLLQDASESV